MWNITDKIKGIVEEVAYSDQFFYEYPKASAIVWRLLKPQPQPDNIDWFVSRLLSETLFALTCPFEHMNELWRALDEKPVVTILTLLFTNFLRLQCLVLCIQLYTKCTRAARRAAYSFAKRLLPATDPVLDQKLTRRTSGPHPHPFASHDCSICGQEIEEFQISVEHIYCGEYSHKQCMLAQLRDARDGCQKCDEPLTDEPLIARLGAITYRLRNLTLLRRRTRLTVFLLICLHSALALVSVLLSGYEATTKPLSTIDGFIVDLIIIWALLWVEVSTHDMLASICVKLDAWGWQPPLMSGLALCWLLRHSQTATFTSWTTCWDFLVSWPQPVWLQHLHDHEVLQGYPIQILWHTYDMLREADAVRGAEDVVPGWLRRLWRRLAMLIIKI